MSDMQDLNPFSAEETKIMLTRKMEIRTPDKARTVPTRASIIRSATPFGR